MLALSCDGSMNLMSCLRPTLWRMQTDPKTQEFNKTATGIVGVLQALVNGDPDRRQKAADVLAAIGKWGAKDYLLKCVKAEGRPAISLAAALALDLAGDRSVLVRSVRTLWGPCCGF